MAPFFIADTAPRGGPGSASTASPGLPADVLTIQDDRRTARRTSATYGVLPDVLAVGGSHVQAPRTPVHAARFGR